MSRLCYTRGPNAGETLGQAALYSMIPGQSFTDVTAHRKLQDMVRGKYRYYQGKKFTNEKAFSAIAADMAKEGVKLTLQDVRILVHGSVGFLARGAAKKTGQAVKAVGKKAGDIVEDLGEKAKGFLLKPLLYAAAIGAVIYFGPGMLGRFGGGVLKGYRKGGAK